MFKDTQKELERLEQELLAEDALEEQDIVEETEAFDFSQFDQDLFDENAPTMVYSGGTDAFRRDMDAYQNRKKSTAPVRARNTDRTDRDMEEYSSQVWEQKKDHSVTYLTLLAVILTLAIVAVVAWWVLRLSGMVS